ncbi:hypothetical protein A3Q56_08355 [Intoshia linei]|uniref:Uncharacterized protein n=1 Tax=Intoshia linei TaxID=1819745 RepID=A0A177ARS6_9BILA|nr:hypothetical protein A3Q56_08355 [Intoshia linei]
MFSDKSGTLMLPYHDNVRSIIKTHKYRWVAAPWCPYEKVAVSSWRVAALWSPVELKLEDLMGDVVL